MVTQYLTQVCLKKDYIGKLLDTLNMIQSQVVLSIILITFGRTMSYYIYVILLYENYSILDSLKDLLSVCQGIVWAVASQLTQVNLRTTFGRRISCLCIWCIVSAYISLQVVIRIIQVCLESLNGGLSLSNLSESSDRFSEKVACLNRSSEDEVSSK